MFPSPGPVLFLTISAEPPSHALCLIFTAVWGSVAKSSASPVCALSLYTAPAPCRPVAILASPSVLLPISVDVPAPISPYPIFVSPP